ncbi:helix-turn-helix transcriptional regulator [Streptomyces sp. NPDC002793]|uniref:helix-turn-helix domain-containing protein n=1 Tax=Streptomyces sp. NPDC002793 TaxID=3154432 RepID=UPI003327BA6D
MTGQRPDHRTAARELGAALRRLQQRSGRTLRSLETEVRISDSSLSRYFRGETVPPWSAVRDLCRALGADPVPYRVLWEAIGSSPPDERDLTADTTDTTDTGGGTGAAPAAAAGPSHLSGPGWWRSRRGTLPVPRDLLTGRAAVATATAAVGALVTAGLLLLPSHDMPGGVPSPGSVQGTKGGANGSSQAGVLVHNVEKACQKPRTTHCALSLAYDPYRPYNTTNSAGRVWHNDLLHATCTIADGVTVTDENHKHTSIWIRTTYDEKQLWLPGIRVHPDHLTQLTAVLPTCTS